MLDEKDFNFDSDVTMETLEDQPESVEAELISNPEEIEEMSLTVQKRNKEALANLRNKVMFALDKRKLGEAQKILTGLENIGDMFSDPEIMEKVRKNTATAQDLKFLSEAYSRLVDSQQRLMRLDSVDGAGNAASLALAVQFEGFNGAKVSTVIQAKV